MNNSTPSADSDELSWNQIVLATFLYALVTITVGANLMILWTIYNHKRLHTAFNFLIVNLAATDMAVGLFPMSFHTTEVLLGYWPFGQVLCSVWIFFDYGLEFASVFSIVAIAADRYWSVFHSIGYRAVNKRRKTIGMVSMVWIIMLALWVPAFVYDRTRNLHDEIFCFWDPSQNREYVVVIAIFGHHGPCVILVVIHVKVYNFLKRMFRQSRLTRNQPILKTPSPLFTDTDPSGIGIRIKTTDVQSPNRSSSKMSSPKLSSPKLSSPKMSSPKISSPKISSPKVLSGALEQFTRFSESLRRSVSLHSSMISLRRRSSRWEDKEARVFTTLTYIFAGYLIMWVPFHIVFDIKAIDSSALPQTVYSITYWMAYVNSAINPFLYGFSSLDFRTAIYGGAQSYGPTQDGIYPSRGTDLYRTNQATNQSGSQSINPPTNPSGSQSINQPIIYPTKITINDPTNQPTNKHTNNKQTNKQTIYQQIN